MEPKLAANGQSPVFLPDVLCSSCRASVLAGRRRRLDGDDSQNGEETLRSCSCQVAFAVAGAVYGAPWGGSSSSGNPAGRFVFGRAAVIVEVVGIVRVLHSSDADQETLEDNLGGDVTHGSHPENLAMAPMSDEQLGVLFVFSCVELSFPPASVTGIESHRAHALTCCLKLTLHDYSLYLQFLLLGILLQLILVEERRS